MIQNAPCHPEISIDSKALEMTDQFTYLGSTISSNLFVDHEIDERIAKASGTMAKLNKRVWSNNHLSLHTNMKVYQACVISTLLHSIECQTIYAKQEARLNSFHIPSLKRILRVAWEDKIPNTHIMRRTKMFNIHALLFQSSSRLLGYVSRMPQGRIPKDILYC